MYSSAHNWQPHLDDGVFKANGGVIVHDNGTDNVAHVNKGSPVEGGVGRNGDQALVANADAAQRVDVALRQRDGCCRWRGAR